jgi:AraC-like DNA-binding protein
VMKKEKKQNEIFGDKSGIEKLAFDLSETQPIRVIHYNWPNKKNFWYDMHYSVELGILLSGRMTRQYQDTQINLTPGDIWLCNMWEPHGFKITKAPCEIIFFEIFPPMLARTYFAESEDANWLAPFYAPPCNRPQATNSSIRRHLLSIAEELKVFLHYPQKMPSIWLRLKLLDVLVTIWDQWQCINISKRPADSFEKVNKAIQLVFESRDRIATEFAAKQCGMNRSAFSRLFSRIMGVDYSEFGLRYRISAVAEELGKTTKPLKAISTHWGFTNVSHMHRCFQKHYGCTPSQYRKKLFVAAVTTPSDDHH